MLTHDRHKIQRDIDYYFRQHAMTDMIVFGNNFIQMCPYTIWKSVLGHAEFDRNSIAQDNSIEELLEKIKELTGEHTLKMETSCGLFYIVSLTLANGIWYLHKCPRGYDSRPMWKLGTTRGSMLSAQDAAELILEFDRYIPQILERAEAAVLERKEKMMLCEILKTTAMGIINQLASDGTIELPGKADVTCMRPESIQVQVGSRSKWIVKSLDELKEKLIKKYPPQTIK
jgi:hypothetical protein